MLSIDDILEIEQNKYCYEQAYALHRHTEIPALFLQSGDTAFAIADDAVSGWDVINKKFCEDLFFVSPNEDSYHTGWQICTPLIWESAEDGSINGVFPTFGYLVLSMDPATMKPPYHVLSTMEMWHDRLVPTDEGWKICDLKARFMIGQCVWNWNPVEDDGLAAQHKLREIPHPYLGKPGFGYTSLENGGLAGKKQLETVGLRSDAYYGIQFAQSLYLLLWQSGRFEEILDRVFSNAENISVCYDDYGNTIAEGTGAVKDFFSEIGRMTEENGGFLQMDLPATQYIEMSGDGLSAIGHWMTMSRRIFREQEKNMYQVMIGRYTNEFAREDGVWKIRSVRWEKLCAFEPTEEMPDMNLAAYRKEPGAWISDLPELSQLRTEESTEEAETILSLRNKIISWLHRFNEERECLESFSEMLKDARYILATSPVIRMEDDLQRAEAFLSTTILYERSPGSLTDTRGSIWMELEKAEEGWNVIQSGWYPYASLEPWKKDRGGNVL